MKAVIFDMDGVIFDSERAVFECWKEICAEHGIPDIEIHYRKCIGVTVEVTERIMRDAYGEDFDYCGFDKQASLLFHARYDNGRLPIKKGARELLSYLKERNIPIALASSTRSERVKQYLEAAGLITYFSHIIGGEMVSKSKPAPDIFLKAAEKLQVEPEDCVVIEDSFNGIRAAAAAGMQPVMVPDMLEPNEEIASLCVKICETLTDFQQQLEENRVLFR